MLTLTRDRSWRVAGRDGHDVVVVTVVSAFASDGVGSTAITVELDAEDARSPRPVADSCGNECVVYVRI